ncbi:hypothetical protein cypCar_00028948 [Cyprinus carpio]|nr:hypothetical protein cypCar_00028948 [Cyprinus carpio]
MGNLWTFGHVESSCIFCWWDILRFGMKTSTNSTSRSKPGLMTSPRQSGTRSPLRPKTSSIRC